jgi:hypothetical protein
MSVGGLVLPNQPLVELLGVRGNVTLDGDVARVVLRYRLRCARSRTVAVGLASEVVPVERDGPGEPAPPWRELVVRLDGKPLVPGHDVAPGVSPAPGLLPVPVGPGTVRVHVARVRLDLQSGVVHEVEYAFTATLSHDDWQDARGRREQSGRVLVVRVRPAPGFAGPTVGLAEVGVDVEGAAAAERTVVEGARRSPGGGWRWEAGPSDLARAPDLVVRVSAPAAEVMVP